MLGIILGWKCWRCGSLETLEDGEGPGDDCAGGRGGGGGRNHFAVGWVSFHFLIQHTSPTSGRRDGDPWDWVEVQGLRKRLREGGRVQSFLFIFRKIDNDGMRPNLFARTEKGGLGGEVKVRRIGK